MGRTKQLLVWQTAAGPKPVVAAAFDAIAPVCDAMVVVLGHQARAVAGALGHRLFHRASGDPDRAMFESIVAGLRAARALDSGADVLVQPGDHPEVRRATLDALLQASADRPGRAVMPVCAGRGGHPVLIPAVRIDAVLRYAGPGGLRQLWLKQADLCFRLAVADPAVVLDLDTMADLPSEPP